MAGMASDGTELARQLEDLREQQRATSGVLRTVARSVGLQPVLDEVVDACTRLSAADYGALWLLEGALLHSVAHHGGAEAEYDRQHPHVLDRSTAAGRTAVTRRRSTSRTSWTTRSTRISVQGPIDRCSACPS